MTQTQGVPSIDLSAQGERDEDLRQQGRERRQGRQCMVGWLLDRPPGHDHTGLGTPGYDDGDLLGDRSAG
eukprot:scaffold100035_cov33-Phaeocystis_antarctica.AAC.1